MKQDARFVFAGTLAAFAVLLSGAVLSRFRSAQRQVMRVEIIWSREIPGASAPLKRKMIWQGAQSQAVFDALDIDKGSGCSGSPSPRPNMAFMKISPAQGKPFWCHLNLSDGQVSPCDNGCLYNLMPQSLAYFRALVAKTASTK